MKEIDSIRNKIMAVSAMTWMWIGSGVIVFSNVLQIVAPSFPSLPLATVGLILNTISVPFTIVQAYRSAREFEQERKVREAKEQYLYDRTTEGRIRRNLEKLRAEMHMDSQEPHS